MLHPYFKEIGMLHPYFREIGMLHPYFKEIGRFKEKQLKFIFIYIKFWLILYADKFNIFVCGQI